MTERTVFTPADTLELADLEALYTRQAALAETFRTRLHRPVWLTPPDLQWGVYTPAYASLLNVLENNLRALYQSRSTGEIEPARTWLGIERDKPRLSCKDVNRWFATLAILTQGIGLTAARIPVTNACTAGGSRTRQWIRTVT